MHIIIGSYCFHKERMHGLAVKYCFSQWHRCEATIGRLWLGQNTLMKMLQLAVHGICPLVTNEARCYTFVCHRFPLIFTTYFGFCLAKH